MQEQYYNNASTKHIKIPTYATAKTPFRRALFAQQPRDSHTRILRSRGRRFLYLRCVRCVCVCVQDFSDLFREICFICIVLRAKRLRYCFSFCTASVYLQRCKVGEYMQTQTAWDVPRFVASIIMHIFFFM